MKFENTKVFNFEGAFRGMRNPLESWKKSDSISVENSSDIIIGEHDLLLAQGLVRAGSEHAKFMRQIIVSVDITAPLYWWKEFDTYKVGTTANSTSTMHKLSTTKITMDCFETDDYQGIYAIPDREDNHIIYPTQIITYCEYLRNKYLETKDKGYWKELIRWLPESWLQKRTITMSYANLRNMYIQRENHKLTEWHRFRDWIEELPYAKELVCIQD